MKIQETFGLAKTHTEVSEQLYGIECEIESVRSHERIHTDLWEVKTDGSLRNNGLEFVSPPVPLSQAVVSFEHLHAKLIHHELATKFSPRTSIHVHANCKNLDEKQVKNIILFYALFEEAFFLMVEPSRRDNIHCVALTDTHLSSRYHQPLGDLWSSWSKYTALNIKPLGTFGTIEFRHSHGHDDLRMFSDWLKVIENLFELGKTTTPTPDNLTEENITFWFDEVFGHTQKYPDMRLFMPSLVQDPLIDIKLSFV